MKWDMEREIEREVLDMHIHRRAMVGGCRVVLFSPDGSLEELLFISSNLHLQQTPHQPQGVQQQLDVIVVPQADHICIVH